LDTGWAGVQGTIIRDKTWLTLDDSTRLLYLALLRIVDRYGNHDYDLDAIAGYFMADIRTGRLTFEQLETRLQAITTAGLIELYTPNGHDKQRFHITNHKIAGELYKIPLPQGPMHPKQTIIGRNVRKQGECPTQGGQVDDARGAREEDRIGERVEESKKGTNLPNLTLTYPNIDNHGGQGYDLPTSEVQALAVAYPALNIPDTVDAFLAYHRDNPDGPQYPRDQFDAVAKLMGWCKQALTKASKPKPKSAGTGDDYLIDDNGDCASPNNTEADWEGLCQSLADDRKAGYPVAAILEAMAERWPGREVPA